MATERISISSTKIVTKNSTNKITFDSDNKYLKKSTTGSFKTGGYKRSVSVAGAFTGTGAETSFWYPPQDFINIGGFPLIFRPSVKTFRNYFNAPWDRFIDINLPIFQTDSVKNSFPNVYPETTKITTNQNIIAEVGPISDIKIQGIPKVSAPNADIVTSWSDGYYTYDLRDDDYARRSEIYMYDQWFVPGHYVQLASNIVFDAYLQDNPVNVTFTPKGQSPIIIGTGKWTVFIYSPDEKRLSDAGYVYPGSYHGSSVYSNDPANTTNVEYHRIHYNVIFTDFIRNSNAIPKNSGGTFSIPWTFSNNFTKYGGYRRYFAGQSDARIYPGLDRIQSIGYGGSLETPLKLSIRTGDGTFNTNIAGMGSTFIGDSRTSVTYYYWGTPHTLFSAPCLEYARFFVNAYGTLNEETLTYIFTP